MPVEEKAGTETFGEEPRPKADETIESKPEAEAEKEALAEAPAT
jgi:hypothetical protein